MFNINTLTAQYEIYRTELCGVNKIGGSQNVLKSCIVETILMLKIMHSRNDSDA